MASNLARLADSSRCFEVCSRDEDGRGLEVGSLLRDIDADVDGLALDDGLSARRLEGGLSPCLLVALLGALSPCLEPVLSPCWLWGLLDCGRRCSSGADSRG